jgi:magnesium transporter
VEIGEIHLFLGPDFVITVRHAEKPNLGQVRRRLEQEPDLLDHGPYAVLYAVLDKIVDDYAPVLDGLQDDIDEIEVQVFGGDPSVSKRIYQLSREVIEFQRAVEPLSDMFDELRDRLKEKAGEADLELRRALRDVADHATRVLDPRRGRRAARPESEPERDRCRMRTAAALTECHGTCAELLERSCQP